MNGISTLKFIKDQTHFRREHQPLRDVGFLFCRGEHGATRTRALTGRIAEQLKMIACAQTFIDYCSLANFHVLFQKLAEKASQS
ncbi:hypothetical protein EDS67_29260 [candidate division KSB1 bacterium]|nr:MAG: hypothetical protein EDS67_29260 [candidate division KSB1 bacterium]MCE7943526.1 hypothetical protein [Chlorobi bacterium CHB1]